MTLMRTAIRFLYASEETITLKDETVTGLSANERAHRGMGYALQNRGVLLEMTVEEVLRIGTLISSDFAGPTAAGLRSLKEFWMSLGRPQRRMSTR